MAINKKGVRGDECKIYRDTAGDYADPTWSEMSALSSGSPEFTRATKEVMARFSKYKGNRLGKLEIKIPFECLYFKGDPDRLALLAAHVADAETDITIAMADGDITTVGTVWHKFSVVVSEYKEEIKDDDVVKVSGTLVLGDVGTYVPSLSNVVSA